MNGNLALVAFLALSIGIGGVAVVAGDDAPPLVADLEASDPFDGTCHLSADINTNRLDDSERLVVERGMNQNNSLADVYHSGQGVTWYGSAVPMGGSVTVYRASVDERDASVDVLADKFVTSDCRLVERGST